MGWSRELVGDDLILSIYFFGVPATPQAVLQLVMLMQKGVQTPPTASVSTKNCFAHNYVMLGPVATKVQMCLMKKV